MTSQYLVLGKNGQLGQWLTRLVAEGVQVPEIGFALWAYFTSLDSNGWPRERGIFRRRVSVDSAAAEIALRQLVRNGEVSARVMQLLGDGPRDTAMVRHAENDRALA